MKKLVLILAIIALIASSAFGQKKTELLMGTASMGGAFYPLGQGIANLVSKYSGGYAMVPVVTGGAVENPRLIACLASLYPSVLHMAVPANSPIKSFGDLNGKRVAVGPAGGRHHLRRALRHRPRLQALHHDRDAVHGRALPRPAVYGDRGDHPGHGTSHHCRLSTITPPVALASYMAAGIAGADINKVGWTAFRYGLTTFILPFMFVYGPAPLMEGSAMEIIWTVILSLFGVYVIASGLVGYLKGPIPVWMRVLLFVGGACMVAEGLVTDLIGAAIFAACLLFVNLQAKKRKIA
ncbi:MAG TPA: hypothetical protein VN445_11315 [Rectinemataceae bacterium]|nr:hypothetical protein [Rectinemataceae bacterium]